MRILNSLLLLLFTSLWPTKLNAEAYDWLRSNVNEFWFNQFVGDCKNMVADPKLETLFSSGPKSCSRNMSSSHINHHLSKDLVADSYFDEALVEMTKQNQCQFDYWSSLNTENNEAYDVQKKANDKLGGQFESLKSDLRTHQLSERENIFKSQGSQTSMQQAQAAQQKIVDQLVDSAYKMAKKEREIKFFIANNPVYTADPKKSSGPQVQKMYNELAVLESSSLFSEDTEVRSFVKYDIVNKINEIFASGKEPNLKELKEFFYSDKKLNFQKRVVEKKLKATAEEQKNYSEIDGKYNDNYGFKVSTVQSGVGSRILNKKVNENSNFGRLQCELDSKYGKGEELGQVANTVVIGGVTLLLSGGAALLARLSQIGVTSQRVARIAQVISTVSNATISASEIAHGLVVSCQQPHFQNKESNTCARVQAAKEQGIAIQIASEIDHSDCLTDLGLAALSGAAAFKSAVKAKQLKKDQQLLQLGLKERYQSIKTEVSSNPSLSPAQKKQLISEIDRSVSLSNKDNFPRQEFLNLLAKEDPEDLLQALTQINATAAGPTWREQVKKWISGKGFNKKEADELEGCLVDSASKTSSCRALEKSGQT